MDELSPKREIKQGRRAGTLFQSTSQNDTSKTNDAVPETSNSPAKQSSPKPLRRTGGWADDVKEKRKGDSDDEENGKASRGGVAEVDERLRTDTTVVLDNDEDDIPVIPDLEDFNEDDLQQQVAAPPSVQVTRVATYKELDHDFEKHAALMTLDGDIDLKLLASVLSPESELMEEDKVWDWDRIYTEISSELRTEWEDARNIESRS